jgi:V8-like Glu-specific endopeptidase
VQEPGESNAVNDYGVILVKKDPTNPRPGFGFSLKHAFQDVKEELHVYGFRAEDDLPSYSSGKCFNWFENQLWYEAQTSKGMSGSPVFIAYKGKETAVAIQYGTLLVNRGANY